MTISLFSQLLADIKSDISPTGIQAELLQIRPCARTPAQLLGVSLFWFDMGNTNSSGESALNPTTTLSVLATHSPVAVDGDDYFI